MTEDQLETAIEDAPKEIQFVARGPVAFAIVTLAAYGAQDLGRKTFHKANKIRINRKSKKVESNEKSESDTPDES